MKSKESVVIIGEGETEFFYFDSLRIAERFRFKLLPEIPSHSDINSILKLAKKQLDAEYDNVICLIDMDVLFQNKTEMAKYQKEKGKEIYEKVIFIETNPCTEFWFLLHFLPNLQKKKYLNYNDMLLELRKYMPGYEKTKKYFKKTKLYDFLKKNGDIDKAIKNGEKIHKMYLNNPEDRIAYSEVYKVINFLNELKIKNGS